MRLICVLVLLAPAVAIAQPSPAPAEPPVAGPEVEATGLDGHAASDAAAGRAYFSETALTAPAGIVTIWVRAPIYPMAQAQLRYAVSDRVEIAVSGLAALTPGSPESDPTYSMLGAHAKAQVWRSQRQAIAVGAAYYRGTDEDDDAALVPTVVATACLDGDACAAVVSATVSAAVTAPDDWSVLAGASATWGRGVQLVGELHYLGFEDEPSGLGYAGLRGAGRHTTVDAGVAFGTERGLRHVEAFPFVAVAMRQ